MEAQRSKADESTTVSVSSTGQRPSETLGELKTRVSSYNALLDDALKELAVVPEEEDHRDLSIAGEAADSGALADPGALSFGAGLQSTSTRNVVSEEDGSARVESAATSHTSAEYSMHAAKKQRV